MFYDDLEPHRKILKKMTQYTRGRSKEYRVCNELKKAGYSIVQRTAGSHSPFDIIAIHPKNHKIKLIQVKLGLFSTCEKNKLYTKHRNLQGDFNVQFKIWN